MKLAAGTALGKGRWHAAGSVDDTALLTQLQAYRRRIAGAYRSVKPGEIAQAVLGAPFHVSPKVDGELWFLVIDSSDACLVSTNGKAISGAVPLLDEVRTAAGGCASRVVIAGELFALPAGKGRPRVGDVATALAGGAAAPVERLGFMAFDLVEGLLADAPASCAYAQRLDALSHLLGSGKRAKPVRTDEVGSVAELPAVFAEWVEGGKAEGLVVRSAQGTIYKIKPEFTIDAAIIGYTVRQEDPHAIRSLLLGLTREDGQTQIAGHCGNLGSDADRRALFERLAPRQCASSFRYPHRSGDLFVFVVPELVAEINVTDLQSEDSSGHAMRSMALSWEPQAGWRAVALMPTASWLHPVLVRLREDKSPGPVDTRFAQLLERCPIEDATAAAAPVQLPAATVLRRQVWTKTTKDKIAVRKLLVWQTNKDSHDPSYPAFVVHGTDYSAGRGTPLDREVRTAPTRELADAIAARWIEENVKKGWEEVV
jgi:hypothetical protein